MRIEPHARLSVLPLLLASCATPPYPRDDQASTVEDQPVEIAVLENDVGVIDDIGFSTASGSVGFSEFEPPTVSIRTEHGHVTLQDDKGVLYEPDRNFQGVDRFFYVAANPAGKARALVTVTVEPDGEQFGEPVTLYASDELLAPLAAMLDADDRPDLVLREGPHTLALLQRADVGLLKVASWEASGDFSRSALVADLDGDGFSDVVRFGTDHSLTVHFARPVADDPGVQFEQHLIDYAGPDAIAIDPPPRSAWPTHGAAGDFDGDGETDLAVGLGNSAGLLVHLAIGTGAPVVTRSFDVSASEAIASGDVTGDGLDDVVVLTERATVEVIHADGTEPSGFGRSGTSLPAESRATLALADLDLRAGDEIVIADGRQLFVLSVDASGPLRFSVDATATELRTFALGDVDADGHVDLVGPGPRGIGLQLWRGTGRLDAPAFEFRADFLAATIHQPPALLDFDRDGALDAVVAYSTSERAGSELVWLPGAAAR